MSCRLPAPATNRDGGAACGSLDWISTRALAQAALSTQREDDCLLIREHLLSGEAMWPSAFLDEAGVALALKASHHVRSVGREIPQRRQIRRPLFGRRVRPRTNAPSLIHDDQRGLWIWWTALSRCPQSHSGRTLRMRFRARSRHKKLKRCRRTSQVFSTHGSTVSPSLPLHPRNLAELTAGSGRLPDDLLCSPSFVARSRMRQNGDRPSDE
jgi:hypothetical protein